MASASIEGATMIEREQHEGTVSLLVKPLAGGELLSLMRIRADIHKPQGKQRDARIEVFFHGSAYAGRGGRMSASDARTWGAALNAVIAEAEKVAEEMRPKRSRTVKKAKTSN